MNYLSHLFFSARTPLSMTGNLMGDFKPSQELLARVPQEIILGIENHRLVDRTTDQFSEVKALRTQFSPDRRRYAGIISDIAFDYFLIKHWNRFESTNFNEFVDHAYDGLMSCLEWMPPRMQTTVSNLVKYDWFSAYESLDGIAETIDQVAKRLRFNNKMHGGIAEVKDHYSEFEAVFFALFEHLERTIADARIERKTG